MKEEKIVQFISFETALKSDAFVAEWEQYKGPKDAEVDVTLQQQIKSNGTFKYISQHRYLAGGFQFTFKRDKGSSKTPEADIRRRQTGGYSLLQFESKKDAKPDESKIFVFITRPDVDLDSFRQFHVNGKLNIYEAYYENCEFSYILEYFVKDEYVLDVMQQLKILPSFEAAEIYKECMVHA